MEEYIKKESILNRLLYLRNIAAEMPMSHDDYVELKLLTKLYEECSNASEQNTLNIVRCKDCIHKVFLNTGKVMCSRDAEKHDDVWYSMTTTDNNHFCSYGERRQEE